MLIHVLIVTWHSLSFFRRYVQFINRSATSVPSLLMGLFYRHMRFSIHGLFFFNNFFHEFQIIWVFFFFFLQMDQELVFLSLDYVVPNKLNKSSLDKAEYVLIELLLEFGILLYEKG